MSSSIIIMTPLASNLKVQICRLGRMKVEPSDSSVQVLGDLDG